MIQKESFLKPIDKTGALIVKAFHLYKGFHRKHAYVGNFIKISVKSIKPDTFIKKKAKSIAIIARTTFISNKNDGSFFYFKENSCLLIKRKLNLRSKDITDAGDYNIRRKKLFYKFPGIL